MVDCLLQQTVVLQLRDLQQRLPLEMTADGRQISRGVVFTNEPASARSFVGVLAVGDGLADVESLLANSAG